MISIEFLVTIATLAFVFAMAAQLLNLEAAWGGMWDLGIAGLIGVGAYSYVLLTTAPDALMPGLGLPWPLGMLGAGVITGLVAHIPYEGGPLIDEIEVHQFLAFGTTALFLGLTAWRWSSPPSRWMPGSTVRMRPTPWRSRPRARRGPGCGSTSTRSAPSPRPAARRARRTST